MAESAIIDPTTIGRHYSFARSCDLPSMILLWSTSSPSGLQNRIPNEPSTCSRIAESGMRPRRRSSGAASIQRRAQPPSAPTPPRLVSRWSALPRRRQWARPALQPAMACLAIASSRLRRPPDQRFPTSRRRWNKSHRPPKPFDAQPQAFTSPIVTSLISDTSSQC